MDVAQCVQLHNELVLLALTGEGRNVEDLQPQTWFEEYGLTAAQIRPELTADSAAFLQQAHILEGPCLHYFITGLASPGNIVSEVNGLFDDESDRSRYLTLYRAARDGHALGLL
jgi:hypothetical protein